MTDKLVLLELYMKDVRDPEEVSYGDLLIIIIIMCIFIYRTYHLSSHGGLQFLLLKGNQINIIEITNLQASFYKSYQIKCWFLVRGENRSTRGKTSHSRVENQQTQSTYDAE